MCSSDLHTLPIPSQMPQLLHCSRPTLHSVCPGSETICWANWTPDSLPPSLPPTPALPTPPPQATATLLFALAEGRSPGIQVAGMYHVSSELTPPHHLSPKRRGGGLGATSLTRERAHRDPAQPPPTTIPGRSLGLTGDFSPGRAKPDSQAIGRSLTAVQKPAARLFTGQRHSGLPLAPAVIGWEVGEGFIGCVKRERLLRLVAMCPWLRSRQ